MRVLDTTSYELQSGEQSVFQQDGYGVTFEQLENHVVELRTGARPLSSPQLDKIRGACETARRAGLGWLWIDSCCINKASTVEETESINSMFKWYRDARRKAPTTSNDTDAAADAATATAAAGPDIFQSTENEGPSAWFSRGWTLQELIAPLNMQFYDMDWGYLGTKTELANALERITRVQAAYLKGEKHFGEACIATKMSWMAGHRTSREEDIAYSMLGILNINMLPQYGEGMRAFMRLQLILLSSSADESLFAWRMPELNAGSRYNLNLDDWALDEWDLLAPSPDWFNRSGNLTTRFRPTFRLVGFSMTQYGLRAPVPAPTMSDDEQCGLCSIMLLTSWIGGIPFLIWMNSRYKKAAKQPVFTLNCWEQHGRRMTPVRIQLRQQPEDRVFKRIQCTNFAEIDRYEECSTPGEGIVLQPQPGYTT